MTKPRCGARPPADSEFAWVTCYRPPDHDGDHAAYIEGIDEIVFWRPKSQAERIHELELRILELEMDRAVPGAMKCDGCGLVVFTAAISMERPDKIGVPISPPTDEACPNGCTVNHFPAEGGVTLRPRMLRPQTWRETDAATTANLLRTWDALEQLLNLSNHYAEQLNILDGGTRFVFDHPGAWLARIEIPEANRTGARPPSLLAQIQDELEQHRICRGDVRPHTADPELAARLAAEVIGFHRGLHWIRAALLGEPTPGQQLEPPITRGQALELANAIVAMAVVAGITKAQEPLDGPSILHLADCLRTEIDRLRLIDQSVVQNPPPPPEDVGGIQRKGL